MLLGNGAGTLTRTSSIYMGTDLGSPAGFPGLYGALAYTAAVADFNGDGRDDFVSTSTSSWQASSRAAVLLANSDGSLGSPSSIWEGLFSSAVAAGDVNGDGKADVLTANQNGVDVLLGNGVGGFGAATYFAGGTSSSISLGDFNGDGKVDILTGNESAGTVGVLLGTGTGAFTPPVNAATGSNPLGVAVGDFNRDGRLDVASASSSSNNVSVLLNDGVWPAPNQPSTGVNDVTVAEGNTGTTAATFTVSLSAAYSQNVSVHYATDDGSATVAGGDYQAAAGTLVFAPGETRKTVTVLVNGDRLGESNESFGFGLSDPTNAFLPDAAGLGTIVDDEPHIRIDYGPVSVAEGNAGSTNAFFTLRLSAAYDTPVSVNFSTFEGDTDYTPGGYYDYGPPPAATAGSDFQAASGTVIFAAGETVKVISIAVYGDRIAEPDEYFSVNLNNPNVGMNVGTIDSVHALGTIVNDEPYASVGGATVVDGNSGTKNMNFIVTLSSASDAPVTVNYVTADGTATVAGGDYRAATGSLTIPAGQTRGTITVLVNGDRLGENDEYFYVNPTGATGAVLITSDAFGTIHDDEPRININDVSVAEGNKGTKSMTFTVTLSAAYDQAVSVHYATQDSSATVAGNDYVAASGTLTFAAGVKTKTVTVTINGDTNKEPDEAFYVHLSGASGNAVVGSDYGVGVILNDDGRSSSKANSAGPSSSMTSSKTSAAIDQVFALMGAQADSPPSDPLPQKSENQTITATDTRTTLAFCRARAM